MRHGRACAAVNGGDGRGQKGPTGRDPGTVCVCACVCVASDYFHSEHGTDLNIQKSKGVM